MSRTPGRLSVLFATEGTYPYHKGGVSIWCEALTSGLTEVDFTLFAVASSPYLERVYDLPPNVKEVITVPIWGTADPAECGPYRSAAEFLKTRWQTTSAVVRDRFVPAYREFLGEATRVKVHPPSFAEAACRLHDHFARYDYLASMSDPATWDVFVSVVTDAWIRERPDEPIPALGELVDAWRLLRRLLTVLSRPIPETDLTHSTAAAFCGLPCIVAKHRRNTAFLLTEHGVYLRERYLDLGRSVPSFFLRWFMTRITSAVADVNYAYADQISPVCHHNTRWERWRGSDPTRIHVIYNGVDPARFTPPSAGVAQKARPRVVCVGLIFPLKGQLDLIDAAAKIREVIPGVEIRLYGSVSDPDYGRECEQRVRDLGLAETVIFCGATTRVWEVYQEADVVAMASISEGFPYAVIEAMSSGAAIVATDVGGVSEALGSAGVLVHAHDPPALADAIVGLLQSPSARAVLGSAARERVREHFTEEQFARAYRASYLRLAYRSAARNGAFATAAKVSRAV